MSHSRKYIKLTCVQCAEPFQKRVADHRRWSKMYKGGPFCSSKCHASSRVVPWWHKLMKEGRRKLGGMTHDLTFEDGATLLARQNGLCAATGIPLDPLARPSLDRINSEMGYSLDNVQFVCRGYNIMKGVNSDKTAIAFLTEVFKHATYCA